MCRGVSHTPFIWAMLHVGNEYAWFVWWTFRLKWCGENPLLLHRSLIWGRMRYAPTLVRLKWWGENLWLLLVRLREGVCDTPLRFSFYIWCCKNNGRPMSFCGHGPPVCLLSSLRFLKVAYSVTSDSTGSLTGSSEATGSSVAGTSESVALFLRNVVTRLSSVFRFSR